MNGLLSHLPGQTNRSQPKCKQNPNDDAYKRLQIQFFQWLSQQSGTLKFHYQNFSCVWYQIIGTVEFPTSWLVEYSFVVPFSKFEINKWNEKIDFSCFISIFFSSFDLSQCIIFLSAENIYISIYVLTNGFKNTTWEICGFSWWFPLIQTRE